MPLLMRVSGCIGVKGKRIFAQPYYCIVHLDQEIVFKKIIMQPNNKNQIVCYKSVYFLENEKKKGTCCG